MTPQERAAIERAAPDVSLSWVAHPDPRFVILNAPYGCPLLHMDGTQASCTVHAVRPFNCRRWGCFRDDCSQPVDLSPVPAHVLQSRPLRREFALMERKAQRWALTHGWSQ